MIVTQDILAQQIAGKEDIDVATVRQVLKSAEDIIFDYLSSTTPSEDVSLKLFNGISINRKYVEKKQYSKGMFKDITCQEHVKTKSNLSKYYNAQINQKLFGR